MGHKAGDSDHRALPNFPRLRREPRSVRPRTCCESEGPEGCKPPERHRATSPWPSGRGMLPRTPRTPPKPLPTTSTTDRAGIVPLQSGVDPTGSASLFCCGYAQPSIRSLSTFHLSPRLQFRSRWRESEKSCISHFSIAANGRFILANRTPRNYEEN